MSRAYKRLGIQYIVEYGTRLPMTMISGWTRQYLWDRSAILRPRHRRHVDVIFADAQAAVHLRNGSTDIDDFTAATTEEGNTAH